MATEEDSKKPDISALTQVDLGEDLLTSTAGNRGKRAESLSSPLPADQYQNIKILINEGFIEDAKKLLRAILIADPHHAAAKQSLQEIHDRELQDLLADHDSPVRRPRIFERKGKDARAPQPTSEDVLQELDRDLQLGLSEPPVFVSLEVDLAETSENDRIDLGVAFFEMGLHEKAILCFKAALDLIARKGHDDRLSRLSATALLVRSYLYSAKIFEAQQLLHSVVRDTELEVTDKLEFFYLMGIALELQGNRKQALPWYAKVQEIDPRYRDIHERMRKPLA